jgi:glutamyl-tRNA synthetase
MARGRYAPSPTGPLHLGNARTAVRSGLEARILDELRWLGLDWDEGPDVGGERGPYRQSERRARYEAALAELRAAGLAYPCFCSRAELAAASQAPHGAGDEGPRYPGTCRALGASDIAARSSRRTPSWRFCVPEGLVTFHDGLRGECAFDVAGEVGDFVVARADGVPAYQLAVVVDDAAMAIEEVVRGDDLLSSTARQVLLYGALDLAAPRFAHVPLVLGEDGARLAKRHGAVSVGELRERGADPRAVTGLLAALSGLAPDGPVHPRDLVRGFALARVAKGAAILRRETLGALLPRTRTR